MDEQRIVKEERGGVLGWMVRHPKTTVLIVLILLFALFVFGVDFAAKQGLKRRIAEIRARGEPTTVQHLIALQSKIPDSDNRMVQMLPIAQRIRQFQTPQDRVPFLPVEGTATVPRTGIPWPDEQLATAQWYLEQIASDVRALHEASKLTMNSLQINWTTPAIIGVTMSNYRSAIRTISKTFDLEAGVAAELGERAMVGNFILANCRFANWAGPDASGIDMLTQIACDLLIAGRIERTINRCGLAEDVLRQSPPYLRAMYSSLDLKQVFKVDRVMLIDALDFIQSGKAHPSFLARVTGGTGNLSYLPALVELDARASLEVYSRLIEAVNGPTMDTIKQVQAVADAPVFQKWFAFQSKSLARSLSRYAVLWVRFVGQTRALEVAISAERYRLARGRWPEAAADLVPEFIAAVPEDPIDGKPIRFARIPEGVKTWTISDDVDNTDHGGDVRRLEKYEAGKRQKDYGWVILNPELRGRPVEETAATSGPAKGETKE